MTIIDGPIFVGLGCSTAARADEIIALVHACLHKADAQAGQIIAMASHSRKSGSLALEQTASYFGVPLLYLGDEALAPEIASTCEAVAAVAGTLRLFKHKSRFATCAIADCAPGFKLDRLAHSPKAASASSTLATSLAGP